MRGLLVALALLAAGCAGCAGDVPGIGSTAPPASAACSLPGPPARPLARFVLAGVSIGEPAGALLVAPGGWWFASGADELDVVHAGLGAPKLVRRIPLPADLRGGPHGLALTPDGRFLLIAAGSGALVLDVPRTERGSPGPLLLGRLTSPVRLSASQAGARAIAITPGGRYAFVARTFASGVAVFDLQAALSSALRSSGYVGRIPVGIGPSALALTPDGRHLLATALAPLPGARSARAAGLLNVIDVGRAELNPGQAVVRTVRAGCEPVAVATTPDDRYAWVAALGDHALLGYRLTQLVSGGAGAPASVVRLPGSPGAVLPFRGSPGLLAADPTSGGAMAIVDPAGGGVSGSVSVGPGIAAVAPVGTENGLLVADAQAARLQLVRVAGVTVTGGPAPRVAPRPPSAGRRATAHRSGRRTARRRAAGPRARRRR